MFGHVVVEAKIKVDLFPWLYCCLVVLIYDYHKFIFSLAFDFHKFRCMRSR